ncbi:MAG TPA: CRISPR-associated endonuclease Cas3'', partial [Bacillota bacterium]
MQIRSILRSHPDKYLADHLREVSRLGLHFLQEKSFSLLPLDKAEQISVITGMAHDLGKATRYFQAYLEAPEEAKAALRKRKNTHHGLFSAVCSYYLAKEVFSGSEGEEEFYPLLCFLVVRRHHGNLGDILDETVIEPGDLRVLKDQLSAIEPEEFNRLAAEITDPAWPVNLSYEHLQRWITGIENENLRSQARKIRRQKKSHFYFLINFFYSLLVDADKTEAAVRYAQVMNLRRFTFPGELVDHYKSGYPFPSAPINKLREEAYREVTTHPFDSFSPGVYTINLPTGLGKTLAAFSFACKLRKALYEKNHLSYRIIYT